jgi:molecular chaperone GrpE
MPSDNPDLSTDDRPQGRSQPPEAGGNEASGPPSPDAVPDMEQQLRELERKATEHHDAWLRAKAEAENIRRRAQEDVAKAHKFGVEKLAADLLPVKDSLEAALATEKNTVESLRNGVELTLRQLESVFERQSLKEINPVGEKFDPHRHQAISMLPSDKEPNTVINVLQKGYLLHDRVVRPALVTVAQAKNA